MVNVIRGQFKEELPHFFICEGTNRAIRYETGIWARIKHCVGYTARLDVCVKGVLQRIYIPVSEVQRPHMTRAREIEQILPVEWLSEVQYYDSLRDQYNRLETGYRLGQRNFSEFPNLPCEVFDETVRQAYNAALDARKLYEQLGAQVVENAGGQQDTSSDPSLVQSQQIVVQHSLSPILPSKSSRVFVPQPDHSQLRQEQKVVQIQQQQFPCPSIPIVFVPRPVQHQQVVYSMMNNKALLRCNYTGDSATGMLMLKTGPLGYVKLRNLRITVVAPDARDSQQWISVGHPAVVYINRGDFERQVVEHTEDEERFGPSAPILNAVRAFTAALQTPLLEVGFQDEFSGTKLTTEMDGAGRLRVVKKKFLDSGTSKMVSEAEIVSDPTHPKIARAKLYRADMKTDKGEVDWVRREAALSHELRARGIPRILEVEQTPSQDIRKVRFDMTLQIGGSLKELLQAGSIPSEKRYKYALQLAQTLAALHAHGWACNDFKAANVLLNPTTDEVIVCDLAEINRIGDTESSRGTFPSPEMVLKNWRGSVPFVKSSTQNDCWAFGLFLYALLYGAQAYDKSKDATWNSGKEKVEQIAKEIVEDLKRQKKDTTDPGKLVIDLLQIDPKMRPPMQVVYDRLQRSAVL